jgi:pSer/pThr/pTyr-binding forkhead associated (FHA) protein
MPALEFVDAEREPFIIDAPELTIGRDEECALVLDVDGADRRHARLTLENDGSVVLRDLGSRGGTRKNGEFVTGAQKLEDGDRIEIGRAALVFRKRTPEPATVVPGAEPLDNLRTVRMAPADLAALGLGHLVNLGNGGHGEGLAGEPSPTKPEKKLRLETLMGAPRPVVETANARPEAPDDRLLRSASFEEPTLASTPSAEEPGSLYADPLFEGPTAEYARQSIREPTDLAAAPTVVHLAPPMPPGMAPPAPSPPRVRQPARHDGASSPMSNVPTAQTALPVLPTAPPIAPLAKKAIRNGKLARLLAHIVDFFTQLYAKLRHR